MENNNKKTFFINMRRDSGELRFLISILFTVITLSFLWAGYKLIVLGTSGDWKIISEFRGWTFYITSLSPGLFIVLLGAIIPIWAWPKVIKNL